MKHHIIIFIIFGFAIRSCSQESKKKVITPFNSNELYGVWANSDFKQPKEKIISATDLFPPVSGFTISYDSMNSKNLIFIQYGEQSSKWFFDTLYFDRDTIRGKQKDSVINICMYDRDRHEISDMKLINYGVYGSGIKPDLPLRFSKISECIVDNSMEAFILDEIFEIFPITVLYNSQTYYIKSARKKCLSYGEISGLNGYSDYQIINVYRQNDQTICRLALYNIKEDKFDFFNLTFGSKNTLQKIK